MTFSGSNNWGKSGNPTYSASSLGVGSDGTATAMQPQTEATETAATTTAYTKPCGCKDGNKKMYYHLAIGALIGAAIFHFYNKS